MSAPRARRQPVSCEPCRVRKIRCSRDPPPCATCQRRSVSHECRYVAQGKQRYDGDGEAGAPPSPLSSNSPNDIVNYGDLNLANRVKKLEQMLQFQTQTIANTHHTNTNSRNEGNISIPGSTQGVEDNLRGSLRVTEQGYVRFMPQHAGADTATSVTVPDSSTALPLGSRLVSRRQLLDALPPTEACNTMVRTYFASFASLFHILHDQTFNQQYSSFLNDVESMPLAWLALLYSMLATATIALPPESPLLKDLSRARDASSRVAEISQRYREMTLKCLEEDQYLWNHNVTTLQALVILIYGIGHTHGPTWTLLGLAHHLAISIGCHVDPDTFGLDTIAAEERRRCWAGLMIIYTSQNTSLGHLGLPHTALRGNSRPPADINDDDLTAGIPSPPGEATQMTYLLLKCRLYDICSEICDKVLSAEGTRLDIMWSLDALIQQERRNFDIRYSQDNYSGSLPTYHQAHYRVLDLYSNHLMLLLHFECATRQPVGNTLAYHSRQQCLESARQMLVSHQKLSESPELAPFRWYARGIGGFHALQAAMTLIKLLQLGCGDQNEDHRLLVATATRFEDMAHLSGICAKSATALRCLLPRASEQASASISPVWVASGEHDSAIGNPAEPYGVRQQGTALDSSSDWDFILDQLQPQQWLSPASLPWD